MATKGPSHAGSAGQPPPVSTCTRSNMKSVVSNTPTSAESSPGQRKEKPTPIGDEVRRILIKEKYLLTDE